MTDIGYYTHIDEYPVDDPYDYNSPKQKRKKKASFSSSEIMDILYESNVEETIKRIGVI